MDNRVKTLKEKMLEANKARMDILVDNPEINSDWTPDAVGIMAFKKSEKIDFTKDSEYIRMFGEDESNES